MSRFVPIDRDTAYLLPPSVDEWLPEDHLARFVVEVIDKLEMSELVRQYAGRGSDAHHPAVLLGLLIYGYSSGVFSSRMIERATYDSVAFRFVAANTHPDHDTHRHVPAPLLAAGEVPVRASARTRTRDEVSEAGQHRAGRHQGARQREQAQGLVVGSCEQDRGDRKSVV